MKKYLKTVITHPLFSGSALMIVGSNSVNFLNYLYHLFMGRMLGPAGYGELVALISVIGLVGVIPLSLNMVIVKFVSASKSEEEVANLIAWFKSKAIVFTIIFSILLIILSPILSNFLHINNVFYWLTISAIFLFSLPNALNRAILQGLLKFKEMIISVLAESILKLIVSLALIFLGLKVGGAIVGMLVAAAVSWYLTNLYLKVYKNKQVVTSPNLKPMVNYALPVVALSVSSAFLYSSDLVLVKHFFSSYETGLYGSLSTLGKIIFFASGPIGSVMFPIISKRQAHGTKYQKIFFYSLILTAFISLVITGFYYLMPSVAIQLLYGSAYLSAVYLLVWFGIFNSMFALSSLIINFNLSIGRTYVILMPIAASLIQILGIWFYHHSLTEVVIVSITTNALLLLLLCIYSFSKIIR